MKVLEMFAGIGGWHKALIKNNIDAKVSIFENNKYACIAYDALHKNIKNYGDVKEWERHDFQEGEFDIIFASPPCQDFSIQNNHIKDRKSLMFDTLSLIMKIVPKIAIIENVRGLTFKKNIEYLNLMISELKKKYRYVEYQVLNSADFGSCQSRERVFIIAKNDVINWPATFKSGVHLWDFLEDDVDDRNKRYDDWKSFKPVIKTTERGKEKRESNFFQIDKFPFKSENIITIPTGLIGTLTASGAHSNRPIFVDGKVRNLTPLERWRIMGFDDKDFEKVSTEIKNIGRLNHLAGNSVVIQLVELLVKENIKGGK